jgi:hypothetical protein
MSNVMASCTRGESILTILLEQFQRLLKEGDMSEHVLEEEPMMGLDTTI